MKHKIIQNWDVIYSKDEIYNNTFTIFIDRDTHLIHKYSNANEREGVVYSLGIITLSYDQNNIPVKILYGLRDMSEYEHTTTGGIIPRTCEANINTQHIKWDGDIMTHYEDTNGNWYDRDVINGSTPFLPNLKPLGEVFERMGFLLFVYFRLGSLPKSNPKFDTLWKVANILNASSKAHNDLMSKIHGDDYEPIQWWSYMDQPIINN